MRECLSSSTSHPPPSYPLDQHAFPTRFPSTSETRYMRRLPSVLVLEKLKSSGKNNKNGKDQNASYCAQRCYSAWLIETGAIIDHLTSLTKDLLKNKDSFSLLSFVKPPPHENRRVLTTFCSFKRVLTLRFLSVCLVLGISCGLRGIRSVCTANHYLPIIILAFLLLLCQLCASGRQNPRQQKDEDLKKAAGD